MHNNLLEKINLHADYKLTFSTPHGQRVLQHICKTGFVSTPTRVKGDPEQTLENEGMRRLALSILRQVSRDHKEIVNRIQEEYNE